MDCQILGATREYSAIYKISGKYEREEFFFTLEGIFDNCRKCNANRILIDIANTKDIFVNSTVNDIKERTAIFDKILRLIKFNRKVEILVYMNKEDSNSMIKSLLRKNSVNIKVYFDIDSAMIALNR